MEYGQTQVAHDLCRYIQQKDIHCLMIEAAFIARASQNLSYDAPVSLRRSQKYRHFASPAKFVATLKNVAVKYGIVISECSGTHSSRICHSCGFLNPSTESEQFSCESCGLLIKQDPNAAVNLSRLYRNSDHAEMKLHAVQT